MKRSLVLLAAAAAGVFAILYAFSVAQKVSTSTLASLLPRETIAFAHMPDFGRSRDEWHQSDIYQLYAEPAVQEFLRKPLGQLPSRNALPQLAQNINQLDPKDAFVAVTGTKEQNVKIVGGFQFRGKQDAAERIIGGWRTQILGGSQHETIDYQQHKIDIYGGSRFTFATTYHYDWFFASNDESEIKALLDRADGRSADPQSLLSADEAFRAAAKEVPSNYALGFYAQPKRLADFFNGRMGQQIGPDQQGMLDRIRSVYATTRFDNGKMHDVIFVGMPQPDQSANLTRESLALGTPETFLYVASLLNFSKQLALLNPGNNIGAGILGTGLDKIATALARANIDINDWQSTFGTEAGLIADWPKNAHWPSGVVAFPVKNFERARQLANVLAHASDEDATWTESDRNGAHYITMQSGPGFLVLRPTIAVTNRMMVIGLDPGSVDAAVQRTGNSGASLEKSEPYKSAAGALPKPENFFAYVDLARFYSRFDETLRPILMMWAAFMPGVNDQVDLNRIPAAEVITKHLSPIVSSQRYAAGGYVTESIGPFTLNQSGLALLAVSALSFRGAPDMLSGLGIAPKPTPSPSPGWLGKGFSVPTLSSPTPSATP